MKQLTQYSKNGYKFSLVERRGDAATFRGVKAGSSSETFEVIHIQNNPGGARIFSLPENKTETVVFEPSEYPPSNNEWGEKGWTCLTFEDAKKKLDWLIEKINLSQAKKPIAK